jgi:hypothetical protein
MKITIAGVLIVIGGVLLALLVLNAFRGDEGKTQ